MQIVALNWQRWDAGMMMNEAMFAGSGGFVLKPEGYRSEVNAQQASSQHAAPTQPQTQSRLTSSNRGTLDLAIEFFAGQDIPLPPEEDNPAKMKPFVKCELHVERSAESLQRIPSGQSKTREGEWKRKTKTTRGSNPDFEREVVTFEGVSDVVGELGFLRYVTAFSMLSCNAADCSPPSTRRHSEHGDDRVTCVHPCHEIGLCFKSSPSLSVMLREPWTSLKTGCQYMHWP